MRIVPRISFEEIVPYSPPISIGMSFQSNEGPFFLQELDFRIGRFEALSVYLDVKYKTSGTTCWHVLPCGHGSEKTGMQQRSHGFNHSVKGKREGRRRELMFHQSVRAK